MTGNEFFRAITGEILDYAIREMVDAAGGFYSTQDADPTPLRSGDDRSEGVEGKFFVWTPDEIRAVLGSEADTFMAAYGVTPSGNFEGKNILEFVGDMDQRPALAEAQRKLFEAREKRVRPGRDEKILTSWNGLMLAAFAEAARAFSPSPGTGRGGRGVMAETYRLITERNADFLLHELRQEDGRLLRTWKAGKAKLNGYLEDYAYLIEGLLELYQTTFEPRWYLAAQEPAETMLDHFADSEGTLYDTSDDHETLITRPRSLQDNATPSGNAMAATVLLKLAGLTNDLRYVAIAHKALAQMQPMLAQYPLGFGQWLQALAYSLSKPREIAILGDPENADTQALLNVVNAHIENYGTTVRDYAICAGINLWQTKPRGLPDTSKHAIILWVLAVSGKLPNSYERTIPMSDFIQQLFETLQLDVAEETSEAVGTSLSLAVIILLALAAYLLTRFILLRILVRFYARTKSKAGEILLEKKVFHRLTLLVLVKRADGKAQRSDRLDWSETRNSSDCARFLDRERRFAHLLKLWYTGACQKTCERPTAFLE